MQVQQGTTVINSNKDKDSNNDYNNHNNPLFDRKVDLVTAGLPAGYARSLKNKVSQDNALIICNYITSMKTEINLSDNYRKSNIDRLVKFSKFHNHKPFHNITREEVLVFLDSLHKPESLDPMHKWIGSYNVYRVQLIRLFKWLYSPDIEPDKRPKPKVMENIPQLRRKERSVCKPSDLWTTEEDLIFLRHCPSKRMKCYHAVARDLGYRPHEILKLRIKDFAFKSVENRQYAEVVVNGKTGTRHLPLIDSLPYVKDYLDNEHPMPGNPNAVFISGIGRSIGRGILPVALNHLYAGYKNGYFSKLLDNPNVPPEDKLKIKELLKKPWNPYVVGRHTSLTQKSRILKESTLRIFAGWTANSDMPRRYIHLFGNAACEDILQAYGLVDKEQQIEQLKPKQCPNCSEPNKPDSKFCAKCRMVLTYDAYSETIEEKQKSNNDLETLKQQMQTLVSIIGSIGQEEKQEISKRLIEKGIYKKYKQ
jgi:integrase/recombinase XerD